jgi:hypothetical protein
MNAAGKRAALILSLSALRSHEGFSEGKHGGYRPRPDAGIHFELAIHRL